MQEKDKQGCTRPDCNNKEGGKEQNRTESAPQTGAGRGLGRGGGAGRRDGSGGGRGRGGGGCGGRRK